VNCADPLAAVLGTVATSLLFWRPLNVFLRIRMVDRVFFPLLEIVALGIDEADTNRQNLEVYKESFENAFLADTELYYKRESETFIAENSTTDYLRKAEARLKEEGDRVDMFLHPSSKKAVRLD
jgi:hypothetical protein